MDETHTEGNIAKPNAHFNQLQSSIMSFDFQFFNAYRKWYALWNFKKNKDPLFEKSCFIYGVAIQHLITTQILYFRFVNSKCNTLILVNQALAETEVW